ncbi:MAG: hypothetical protein R3C05_09910 [Pirellulaceae bacterium]
MSGFSNEKLDQMLKLCRMMGLVFGAGIILMLTACFSGSAPWAFYCVMMGWIGIVLGTYAGTLWAEQLLGKAPPHRQVSQRAAYFGSIFTFWIPSLAAAVFGMGLVGALPESLQPKGYSDSPTLVMFQSFVFYFVYGGQTWISLAKEIRQSRTIHAASNAETIAKN